MTTTDTSTSSFKHLISRLKRTNSSKEQDENPVALSSRGVLICVISTGDAVTTETVAAAFSNAIWEFKSSTVDDSIEFRLSRAKKESY